MDATVKVVAEGWELMESALGPKLFGPGIVVTVDPEKQLVFRHAAQEWPTAVAKIPITAIAALLAAEVVHGANRSSGGFSVPK